MKNFIQQMNYLRNIILTKKNKGFSLIEIIISIAVSTFLITAILSGAFFLYRGFVKTEESSIQIYKLSKLYEAITMDVLNTDIFPHHPLDQFTLEKSSIVFFANGNKVEYKFENNIFHIKSGKKKSEYKNIIREFDIKYYDMDAFEVGDVSKEFPFYCSLNFTFMDNKKISLEMRL